MAMTDKRPWLHGLLREEAKQREEEGCDSAAVQQILSGCGEGADETALDAALAEMAALPIRADFPCVEPVAFEPIKTASPGFAADRGKHARDIADLDGRVLGAWLGRCAGCALGKPLEREPYVGGRDGKPGWQWVRTYLNAAGAWPLEGYVPDAGEIEGCGAGCPNSTRERISFMETDDDIRYTVIGLQILEGKGPDFTTTDVARHWMLFLPPGQTFTAERAAYRNFLEVLDLGPLEGETLDWVRTHRNPYREWIGAQIRADGFAYCAAGRPARAAEFAYRDAALTHVKNGVYGEMLFAATIAAGFTLTDTVDALRAGLAYIPQKSRLHADILEAIEMGLSASSLDDLHAKLWQRWGHYPWVHTNNNAALVAAALAWGGADFGKTITAAVTGGWDTDCNGATAGSVWGAVHGSKALPAEWTSPLHDTLYALIPGFHPIAISECAHRTAEVARRID